jgi:hypothetical protein
MEDHTDIVCANFANPYVGGGALRKGCAQEEILFSIFPQLYVSILICERLSDNEAIFMSNFRRYASYEGYQMTTKIKDPASLDGVSRMDFVAIDATKFTKYGGAESLSEED